MFSINFGDGNLVNLAEREDYEFPHPVQRWVMPLIAYEYADGRLIGAQALGSSFAIGPQLLVTAKHVLDPMLRDPSSGAPLDLREDMSLHAIFLSAEPFPGQVSGHGAPIPIWEICVDDAHDLAVLTTMTLDSADGEQPTFTYAPLTIQPPTIGSAVLALGYPQFQASITGVDKNAIPTIAIDQRPTASRGQVEEYYVPQRDSMLVNFPAMQADLPSPSGMSGGPVITEDGRVCGVVSRSMDSIDGETWTSFCALLPPLFALRVNAKLEGIKGPWSIRDLAERRIVPTDGTHANVQLEESEGEQRITWFYREDESGPA